MNTIANAVKSLALVAGFAAIGFAAVYFTMRPADNAPSDATGPTAAKTVSPAAGKASPGKMAAFVRKKQPEAVTDIEFQNAAGDTIRLSDFKGRTVLLNLWATWCAPCREEMPALNRLQEALGGDTFEVVALSLDRQGAAASQKFLDEVQATALKLYTDSTAKQGSALRLVGMPTTILIDAEGREVGRLAGPAEWDSDEAKDLIRTTMN
jgi:thiol-disulfide isomerase/thioredoxin